jgi:PAS domain S-box-containing protein
MRELEAECPTLRVRVETGEIVAASAAAVRLLGDPPGGLLERRLEELRPSWAGAMTRELLGTGRVLGAGDRSPAAVREQAGPWLGAGGELIYADTVATPLADVAPPTTGLLLHDVTDRHRLEESLAQTTGQLHQAQTDLAEARRSLERVEIRAGALFQHTLDAVLLVETESHTIVQANPAACALTGYSLAELLWRPLADLDPSEDLRHSRGLLHAAQADPAPMETLLRRADGSLLRAAASTVLVTHGAYQAMQIILHDLEAEHRSQGLEEVTEHLRREISELETANRRLEAANRAKAEFLAEMSHEIRTPLNAVVGFSELLEASSEEMSSRQRQFVGDIRAAAEHLLGLMSDLLDLAGMEAGRLAVQSEPLALGPLVQGVAAVAEALAQPRHLRLTTRVDPPELGAYGDERRVRQVLYNLLSNAVRYGPPGSEVRVEARREGPWARVSVRDQGPGIPEEYQERIFEEFVRLPVEGEAASLPGTGLGLAVSQRLVKAMGGALTVASAPGQGSEFTFLLPLYEPVREELPEPVPKQVESLS